MAFNFCADRLLTVEPSVVKSKIVAADLSLSGDHLWESISVRRPGTRWADDLRTAAGSGWMREAHDRALAQYEEGQQWTDNGYRQYLEKMALIALQSFL